MAVTYYSNLNDVINEYVKPALHGWTEEYDLQAIAQEISEFNHEYNENGQELTPNHRNMRVDEDAFDFWDIVARHDIQA